MTPRWRGALLLLWLSSCGPGGGGEQSTEECAAAKACRSHGRCTFDRRTKKCVVGSDQDCTRAKICHTENRCRKVGDVCDQ